MTWFTMLACDTAQDVAYMGDLDGEITSMSLSLVDDAMVAFGLPILAPASSNEFCYQLPVPIEGAWRDVPIGYGWQRKTVTPRKFRMRDEKTIRCAFILETRRWVLWADKLQERTW